jgi:hypothetical protein
VVKPEIKIQKTFIHLGNYLIPSDFWSKLDLKTSATKI